MNQPSLQSRLRERLERSPERRALAFHTPEGKIAWVRFDETYGRAERLAATLAERGLGCGDVGIIVLPSGELSTMTTLAMLLAGAVPLLIAPPVVAGSLLDLPRILVRTARETRARVVVGSEGVAAMRDEIASRLPRAELLLDLELPGSGDGAAGPSPVLPASDEVAAMQLTSGTTGFPRVCVWEHHAVLAALDGMTTAMKLRDDDVCLNWTPLYHDMGLVNNFLLCLTSGVPLVMMSPEAFVRRPALWPRALSDAGATVTWSPNFGFALAARRVRDDELEGVRLDRVRACWNAAERIHHGTLVEFAERYEPYGLRADAIKTNFGCAENIGGATFSDPDGPYAVEHVDGDALYDSRVAHPVSEGGGEHATAIVGVGRPHPAMGIRILSDEGEPLPDGHVGEIALRTPSRMRGYLNDDESNRWALRGDLVCTGDLGYLRGEELFWVGRSRERITVRGKKLDPSDFEPVLFDVAGLRDGCFVAFGVDEPELGTQRIVVATEVREPFKRAADEIVAEIQKQAFLRMGVAISEVLLVRPRTLAKTSSGKRRHRHFRELYLENGLDPYLV